MRETRPAVLGRDRLFIIVSLGVVTALAWLYLLAGAGMSIDMPAGHGTMLGPAGSWSAGHATIMLAMWWVMMLAMMLPSAVPMVMLFAAVNRKQRNPDPTRVVLFVAAYAVVWGGFSGLATAAQWLLDGNGLLDPRTMALHDLRLAGALLVVAGVYQLTPWKHACLRRCRSPLDFLLTRWRGGAGGAFVMGAEHGAYCLGCCWVMMLLLFAAGVMNLAAVAVIATFVLIEKLGSAGHWVGRLAGVALVGVGAWMLA